ncbi:MAG: VCBS repeat-containing protein [Elusimicrobia bacterium]|nr:VCBS repeat-containing protein [Elusimicrobiota bacterium]
MHCLAISLALSCWTFAQTAPPPGYVVRSETGKVYIDYGEASGIKAGDVITVYKEGEELRHPVTKALLGRLETVLGEGIIREVRPKYSIVEWTRKSTDPVPPGARARVKPVVFEPSAAAQPAAAAPTAPVPPAPSDHVETAHPAAHTFPDGAGDARPPASTAPTVDEAARAEAAGVDVEEAVKTVRVRRPRWQSPEVFDFKAVGMAIGDFDGDGALDLALADDKEVHLYPYPPKTAKSRKDYRYPGITPHIMSLEAADLNGNGKAELFITVFNEGFPRMETSVIEIQAGGHWVKLADMPWIVRSYQGAKGSRLLAVQQLLDNKAFPFSSIFPLEYRDGKYGPGRQAVRFKRVDWIYDFTTVAVDDSGPGPLYHMSTDRIRLDLKKGSWKSPEPYSQTPNRLRWADRVLQCRPPLLVRYDDKSAPSLYAVRNIAKFGGLAHTFGLYARAELHRKAWNGLAFETTWKSDMSGFSPAQAWAPGATPGSQELAVTVVGTTGKSAVWVYDP